MGIRVACFPGSGYNFPMNRSTQSLLLGLTAVLCWASLATLGNLLRHLPPFYILAVAFIIGSLPAWKNPRAMSPSWSVSCWGIFGYFSYHFFLFYSFRFAPAIEANLINYLWPMILVLLTPVFFREARLKLHHFLGAGLGVLGTVVLVSGEGADLKVENTFGYILAFLAALSWPIYSLGKKKMGETTLFSIGGFCLGAGILCLVTHLFIEPRVVLQMHDVGHLVLMGVGPFGLAFYAWDLALVRGDGRIIGALSYLTPVLSTLGLILFAGQSLTQASGLAMVLIISGASSGLLDFLPSKSLVK